VPGANTKKVSSVVDANFEICASRLLIDNPLNNLRSIHGKKFSESSSMPTAPGGMEKPIVERQLNRGTAFTLTATDYNANKEAE